MNPLVPPQDTLAGHMSLILEELASHRPDSEGSHPQGRTLSVAVVVVVAVAAQNNPIRGGSCGSGHAAATHNRPRWE